MFGIGGAELLVIAGVALILLLPGAALFGLGYLTGKHASDATSTRESEHDAPVVSGDSDA